MLEWERAADLSGGFSENSMRVFWIVLLAATLNAAAQAETLSAVGSAQVTITEVRLSQKGASATDSGDTTSEALPVQVVATLKADDGTNPSAGAVAAQFADPAPNAAGNPREFAINLTLNSISKEIQYEAFAESRESREIVFAAGELGVNSQVGDVQALRGKFFIDGALLIVSALPDRDLTGANVSLRVRVEQSGVGTVFSGEVGLIGEAGNGVRSTSGGDFPVSSLIRTDLSAFNPDFDAFQVLIIPNIEVEYDYEITVGTPTTLTAVVEVQAANVPDNVGVAAVIGTPAETLTEVLNATAGEVAAAKARDSLLAERENPTGELAFPETTPLGAFCGLFGVELLLGLAALVGWKRGMA
jgi:hypothetical protein